MTTSDWFSTTPAQHSQHTAFLAALADAAEQWTFTDLGPADTLSDFEFDDGRLLVAVTVPGLTSKRQSLRVQFHTDAEGRPVLDSAWALNPYPVDEYEDTYASSDEDVDLRVSGVDTTPEQCGRWAAAWFERQLSRRVVRREWDRPPSGLGVLLPGEASGPVAVEWSVDAPERSLERRGGFTWWWLMRRPPSRTLVERPGVPAQT